MYNATIEPKSIHLAQAEHTSEIGSLHMLDEITQRNTSKISLIEFFLLFISCLVVLLYF